MNPVTSEAVFNQPFLASEVIALVFSLFALVYGLLWWRERDLGMGWFTLGWTFSSVFYFSIPRQPQDHSVSPWSPYYFLFAPIFLSLANGLVDHLKVPEKWRRSAIFWILAPIFCYCLLAFFALNGLEVRLTLGNLLIGVSYFSMGALAWSSGGRDPGAGHRLVALTLWTIPLISMTLALRQPDARVLKFYAAIPIILLAMILLTASLRRGQRALKAEISRRADAETALMEVNALLEMRLVERTEAAELKAQHQVLTERIAALDRQRSLGQMSATLAHEINQPLTAIQTSAQALKRSLDVAGFDRDKQLKMAEKIVFNVRRAAEIISKIRNFIKPAEVTTQPIDMDVVVKEVVDLLKHDAIAHKAEVQVKSANAPAVVMGDALQLSQVLVNLLRNAFEAIANSPDRLVQICSLVEGEDLILTVQDSGPGFSADMLEIAGTPYFTSKAAGLGIGLSISRDILTLHGGKLTIANGESGGALMEIRLPLGYSAK